MSKSRKKRRAQERGRRGLAGFKPGLVIVDEAARVVDVDGPLHSRGLCRCYWGRDLHGGTATITCRPPGSIKTISIFQGVRERDGHYLRCCRRGGVGCDVRG